MTNSDFGMALAMADANGILLELGGFPQGYIEVGHGDLEAQNVRVTFTVSHEEIMRRGARAHLDHAKKAKEVLDYMVALG